MALMKFSTVLTTSNIKLNVTEDARIFVWFDPLILFDCLIVCLKQKLKSSFGPKIHICFGFSLIYRFGANYYEFLIFCLKHRSKNIKIKFDIE